jgi:hypothetical protein
MDVANIMQKTPPMANASNRRQHVTRLTLGNALTPALARLANESGREYNGVRRDGVRFWTIAAAPKEGLGLVATACEVLSP